MSRNHLILKQIFEIGIGDESAFPQISAMLAELMKKELPAIMDEVLNQYAGNRHIVIDKLEIDLGALSMSSFRKDVLNAFRGSFIRQLDQLLSSQQKNSTAASLPSGSRDAQTLFYVLAYGRPPWWHTRDTPSIHQLLSRYLQQDGEKKLRVLWRMAERNEAIRRRLLHHIQLDILMLLWQKNSRPRLSAQQYDAVNRVYQLVEKWMNLPGHNQRIEHMKTALIRLLLMPTRSLHRLPAWFDPVELITGIPLNALPADQFLFFRELFRHANQNSSLPVRSNINRSDILPAPEITDFKLFLESGYIPSGVSERRYTDINQLFRYLLDHHLEEVAALIRILGRSSSVRSRFLDRIGVSNVRLFFERIAPEKAALFDWIAQAYIAVQETYRPINQTNINVQRSINRFTLELYVQNNLNNLSSEAFMQLHFERMSLRYNLMYDQLLDFVLRAIRKRKQQKLYKSPFNQVLEKLLHRSRRKKNSAKTTTVWVSKTVTGYRNLKEHSTHLSIPPSIWRELQLLYSTHLLGKHGVYLKSLLQQQQRWKVKATEIPDEGLPLLFRYLSEQLHLDEAILKRIMLLQSVALTAKGIQKKPSGRLYEWILRQSAGQRTQIGETGLIDHLLQHKETYQPRQVRLLLNPYIIKGRPTRKNTEKILRILYPAISTQIQKTLDHWLTANAQLFSREMAEKVLQRFLLLSGTYMEPDKALYRIFEDTKLVVPENIRQQLITPPSVNRNFRLSKTENPPDQYKKQRTPKKTGIRENQLLTFYDLLKLESELSHLITPSFLDHVSFSFDLLRGKYREPFLRLLQEKIMIPEVAVFLSEDAQQPLLREILQLLPPVVTQRMQRLSRMLLLLMRLFPVFSIPATERSAFLLSQTLPWYFAPADALPSLFDLFHILVQKAQKEGYLLPEAGDLFRKMPDLQQAIRHHWASMYPPGKGRLVKASIPLAALLKETADWRRTVMPPIIRSGSSDEETENRLFLLTFIIQHRVFPDDHPFFPESIAANVPYFRTLLQEQKGLLIRLYSISHPPKHHPLLLNWLDLPLALTLLAHFSEKTNEEVLKELEHWKETTSIYSLKIISILVIQTYMDNPSFIRKKSLTFVIAQMLLKEATLHPLELLAYAVQLQPLAATQLLPVINGHDRLWKEMETFLAITRYSEPQKTAHIQRWLPFIRRFTRSASPTKKVQAMLSFWKGEDADGGTIENVTSSIWTIFLPLADLSVSEMIWLLLQLLKEGVTVQQLQVLVQQQKTKEGITALILLEQPEFSTIRTHTTERKIKELVGQISSRWIIREQAGIPNEIEAMIAAPSEGKASMGKAYLQQWLESGKPGFPIETALSLSSPAEWLEWLDRQRPGGPLVLFFERWLAVIQKMSLPDWRTSPEKKLFRLMIQLRIAEWNAAGKADARLLRQLISMEIITPKQVPIMLNAWQQKGAPVDFLIDPELLRVWKEQPELLSEVQTWLTENTSELIPKWLTALASTEQEPRENTDDDPVEKQEAAAADLTGFESSFPEEKSFRYAGNRPLLPPAIQTWLEWGQLPPAEETAVRTSILQLPVLQLITQEAVHPTALLKLSSWLTRQALQKQFRLSIQLNIRERVPRQFFQEIFQLFIERANRQQMQQLFQQIQQFSRSMKRWDRPIFWETLIRELLEQKAMEQAFQQISSRWRRTGSLPVWAKKLQRKLRKREMLETTDFIRLLEVYLESGVQTWKQEGLTTTEIEEMVREIWKQTPRKLLYLFHIHSRKQAARKRVLELLRQTTVKDFFDMLHPRLRKDWDIVENLFKKYVSLNIREELGIRNETDLWEQWLFHWSTGPLRIPTTSYIFRDMLQQWVGQLEESRKWVLQRLSPDELDEGERQIWKQLKALLPALERNPEKKENKEKKEKESPKEVIPVEEDAKDGITVYNAGLVLLWPFLSRYFRMLQLADDKAFRDDTSLERAIQLTQYLVNSRTEIDETQLVLNKLLCGAAFTFPVATTFEPSPEERGLSEKMLKGALQNWEMMKTTKPETFQETFLQREGRLYKMDNRWELVVEKKAYDMLLDSLPWNISMIQLSWMSERLVVIWR
jgi:hypothetical protein